MTLPHNNIEDVLCSKTKLKMLKVLMRSELVTVSELAKRTTVNYVSARTHLETLENENIVTLVMFGKRIRYYKFKDSQIAKAVKDSQIAKAVKDLIEAYSDRSTTVSRMRIKLYPKPTLVHLPSP